MRLLFIILLFFSVLYTKAQNNTDHWEAYMAQYDEGPGSTTVNMSLKEKSFAQHRFLVITGVRFQRCKDGFPLTDEFEKLYSISDSVQTLIAEATPNPINAGSFTLQCERVDYVYVKDTNKLRERLALMYKKSFPSYQPIIKLREDKSWEAYHSFLYPNEETIEYIQNSKVVLKLKEEGDKLNKSRPIDHWLYFKTEKDMQDFITVIQLQKYKVEGKQKSTNKTYPFQLHLVKYDMADLTSICKITAALKKEATKYNGRYDGWESVVVR